MAVSDTLTMTGRKRLILGTGGLTMAKAVLISIRPEWVEKIAKTPSWSC